MLRNHTHEVSLLDRLATTNERGRVVYQDAAGPLVGCRFTITDADPLAHADGSPLRASDVVRLADPPGGDWTVTGVRWSPVALRVDLTRVTP